MLMTATDLDRDADTPLKVGELAHLTAECLTAQGFRVTEPDSTDTDGRVLLITCLGRHGTLYVGAYADIELQWTSDDGGFADARQMADMAAALLSDPPRDRSAEMPACSAAVTLKGVVGRDLESRGYDVELIVYRDEPFFGVSADIGITTGERDQGTVYINDDGGLMWQRDFWDEHLPAPDLAHTIATTLARAALHHPSVQ